MIRRLRQGQAEEADRRLALLLVERGLLSADEAQRLRAEGEPGTFVPRLVERGLLSPEQAARFHEETVRQDVLQAAAPPSVPDEVRQASADTARRVGKYVLVARLGEGGMGEVWKAWDDRLGRWVALKFLREARDQQRFQREAGIVARLTHPNIVAVYDILPTGTRPCIAMQFIDGRSLERAQVEPRRAAEIVRDAARAVHAAHEQGIVHRDLKPANLLESKEGRVYVADFGLGRVQQDGGKLTVEGALLGTPGYMAPEQAQGRTADARTDVFGLGATLYALLERRAPYEGGTTEDILNRAALARPAAVGAGGDLAVIVGKAMEKERPDRYATAAELADDLDRYLKGEPIEARPLSALSRALLRAGRRPLLSGSVLLVLALLASGAVLVTRSFLESRAASAAEKELEQARRIWGDLQRLSTADPPSPELTERAFGDLEARTAAAVARAPRYLPALQQHARVLLARRRFAEAETFFTRILDQDSGHADARAGRGLARLFRAEIPYPTLITDGQTLRVEPALPSPDTLRGIREAAKDLEALPESHPDLGPARGLVAFAEADYAGARAHLRRAVEQAPYLLEPRELLARAELAAGEFARAERDASAVIALGLRSSSAYATRAYARAATGRLEEAVADALEALGRDPAWSALRGFVGFWQVKLGRPREALAEYDRLLQANPDHVEHLLGRSLARYLVKDLAGARADAERAARLGPMNATAYLRLGLATETDPEAVGCFTRALELRPDWPEALAARAARQMRWEKYLEAERDFKAAVKLDPHEPRWRLQFALFLLHDSRYPEADREFSELIRLFPDAPDPVLYRGRTRFLQGRYAEALADLERVRNLNPGLDNPELRELMEECRRKK